jgi:hypothetical protein
MDDKEFRKRWPPEMWESNDLPTWEETAKRMSPEALARHRALSRELGEIVAAVRRQWAAGETKE